MTASETILAGSTSATNVTLRNADDGALLVMAGATPTLIGRITATPSMVRLNTANGYGSANTMIRRFTNVVTNQGTDITYADSATLGASFTINNAGVYAVSYSDQFSVAAWLGVSVDSLQLSIAIQSITAANILAATATFAGNVTASCSFIGYIASGSVIRPHTNAQTTGSSANTVQFTITRVA